VLPTWTTSTAPPEYKTTSAPTSIRPRLVSNRIFTRVAQSGFSRPCRPSSHRLAGRYVHRRRLSDRGKISESAFVPQGFADRTRRHAAHSVRRRPFCPGVNRPSGKFGDTGVCAGQVNDDGDHTGGHWFNNRQTGRLPQIRRRSARPLEIWRLINSSGSRSYDLSLTDETNGAEDRDQVLAIDGVTIDANRAIGMGRHEHGARATSSSKWRVQAWVNQLRREPSSCATHVRDERDSRGRATA